jgi:hypothetical protein
MAATMPAERSSWMEDRCGTEVSIGHSSTPLGRTMTKPASFTHLDDPAFLDERARLRGRLERMPENASGRDELVRLHEEMTKEFLRRARIAWTSAPAPVKSRATR